MDLLKKLPTDEFNESQSDSEPWNSDNLSGKNQAEEIQRFLNLMWKKGSLLYFTIQIY